MKMEKRTFHLFVYGTLTDPRVLKAITGKQFEACRATLKGYRKIDPPYSYPLLMPDPRHSVEGTLLLDVDEASLRRLDDYEDEGHIYRRCKVRVWVENQPVEAFAYFGDPERLLKSRDLKAILEEIHRV